MSEPSKEIIRLPKEVEPSERDQLVDMIQQLTDTVLKQQKKIHKLEEIILSLRNERAAVHQWVKWVKGIVAGFEVFNNPDYVAESAWKDNPPWRENQEGGKIHHPETTKKRSSFSNSAFFGT